jgi:preflagellin peptidase FlaK
MYSYFYSFIPLVRRLVLLLALAVAGYQDFIYREIEDKTWLYASVFLAPLTLLELAGNYAYLRLYLVSLLLGVLISLVSLRFKLAGEADAIAFTFISAFELPHPTPLSLLPLGSVIILSLAPTIAYMCYNLYWNIKRGGSFLGYDAGPLTKAVAVVTMRYISQEEYERRKHIFIPATRKKGDHLSIEISPAIPGNIEKPELEEFWAVTLAPYVSFLAVGYLLYTLLHVIL